MIMKISRRSFLKKVSAVSVAPLILPACVWSAANKPNDRIVMGFIGMGKQSRGLLRNFLQQKICRVVAVCDVDTTRREDAQQQVVDIIRKLEEDGLVVIVGGTRGEEMVE